MKTIILGTALGLALLGTAFAGDADTSSQNSRASLVRIETRGLRMTVPADRSTQNSKAALVAVSPGTAKEIGQMAIVYAEKGGKIWSGTVTVTE